MNEPFAKKSTLLTKPSESWAVAEIETLDDTVEDEPSTGLKIVTTGLVVTVIFTGFELVTTPELSVTRALKVYEPAETLFHKALY